MSIDGFLDGPGDSRLTLSNEADLDRVDEVRAGCDAILVGAATVRRDNPRLVVRSPARRQARLDRGLAASPTKVTVTEGGALEPDAAFFTVGDADRLVYCDSAVVAATVDRLTGLATVVDAGQPVDLAWVREDLGRRGVGRLMVEGGGRTLTCFLETGLADELQLAVAPVFVGDSSARRMVDDGRFPWCDGRRAELAEVRQVGDVALLTYALSPRFGRP